VNAEAESRLSCDPTPLPLPSHVGFCFGPGALELMYGEDGLVDLTFEGSIALSGLSHREARAIVAMADGQPSPESHPVDGPAELVGVGMPVGPLGLR